MTVAMLKKILQSYPDKMPVVVDGYEEGYDSISITRMRIITIVSRAKHTSWEGEFTDATVKDEGAIQSLVIGRSSN